MASPAENVRDRSIWLIAIALLALLVQSVRAAEVIPPKPDRYFNDYAGVVSKEAAHRFNERLAQFERDTSNQVVVAVFPKMQSNSDVADYTQRVAQAWGVGQKDRRNGVVLFVFTEDRQMFIQVGYGLEGALPDVTAFDITEYHIKPYFRVGDYEGGLATGIDLICKAILGEYKGSGKTVAEQHRGGGAFKLLPFLIFVIVLIIISRRNPKTWWLRVFITSRRSDIFPDGRWRGRRFVRWRWIQWFWRWRRQFWRGWRGLAVVIKMRTKQFLSRLEHDQIVAAIRAAESKTSGEMRVYIQRGKLKADPLISAQKKFHRLRMDKTSERNAVLIFIAPRAHKFAVVGDQAIHEKCGEEFWQRVVDCNARAFPKREVQSRHRRRH